MGAPSPQATRLTSKEATDLEVLEARQLGGNESSARRGITRPDQAGIIELTKDDFDHATRCPVLGWPTHKSPFGNAVPGPHLTRRIFNMGGILQFPGISFVYPSDRNRPISDNLFLKMHPGCSMNTEERNVLWRVSNTKCINWRNVEFINTPEIIGKWPFVWATWQEVRPTNFVTSVQRTPPAMRKASIRKLMGSLQAQMHA